MGKRRKRRGVTKPSDEVKDVKNVTPQDLMQEGRRYVFAQSGDRDAKGNVRVDVVFEGHPIRFNTGCVTNDPERMVEPYWVRADRADELTEKMSLDLPSINSKEDYLEVLSSSLAAYERDSRVRVVPDEDTMTCRLVNGMDDEIDLEEDDALRLVRDLCRFYEWDWAQCPKCGVEVKDHGPCCEDEDEDWKEDDEE